jgi:alanine-glyoxylate transaminase/serine-glyoxylate transaminase/serine-pyruvate transaminase
MHRPALDIYSEQMLDMTDSLLRDLATLFATKGRTYIYIANGHGAWEAVLSNVLSRGDEVLVLESGRFAVGWGNAAAAMGAKVEVLKGDWRRAIRPAEVEARLRQDKEHKIKVILAAQIDTASGAVNDIEAIGKAIKASGHPALFMVDTVASLGCMPFEMDAWGIDVAMSGSQKGLMAPPGLGFVAANERARAVHKTADLRTPYWDWTERDNGMENYRKYAGTAPVHLLFALRQSMDMLFEEKLENVFQRHRLLAEAVRRAVGVWAERAVGHGHDGADDGRSRPRRAASLLQGEMRRGAGRRNRRAFRPGVSDRPYGPRQRTDDPGHARRHRGRPQGAQYPAWQRRRRRRDRMARRNRQRVMRAKQAMLKEESSGVR